ncbi:MAG: NYN domain-containing protein [Ruminococcus sp.]|nr:NYN domain-containing protein [Ruminococcus sp.]MCM1380346.1 NYN domain-containing protein [Muribaculaceae bacterium]MCM1478344.1 NYN domain-containing protein [Muribaculaceae bacterium]
MVFIDFENFDIAKNNYYKSMNKELPETNKIENPKLDFNLFPQKVVELLPAEHVLVKTFLFAPKPDDFLMQDTRRGSTYNWINGMKNQDYFTVVEGTHSARPVAGYTYQTMEINNRSSYYVVEKGTDINIAAHLITKGFMNAYDTAVIMSGDTDYIPVMDILNTLGKTVVVVGVKGQNLFKFKHHTDKQIILDIDFFSSCLRK